MRILFVMRHPQYVRNYESTLEALAKRGHTIHLAFTPLGADTGPPALAQQLAARHPGIRFSDVPGRVDVWTELVKQTRSLRDRLRYQHEDFRHCADLARRASVKAETLTRWLSWLAPARMPPRVWRGLDALLRRIEAAIPPAPSVSKAIRRIRPDVVLATPLVDLGSQQREIGRAHV